MSWAPARWISSARSLAAEVPLCDAVQRVRDLLAAAPPPRASSPVVEAGLLAVELVLDPLASEEARIGLHLWPGLSPAQARRKMMKLCHLVCFPTNGMT